MAAVNGTFASALDAAKTRCQPGDTILFPASIPGLIPVLCDFTQSITVLPRDVICVMTTPRPHRD